MDLAMTVIAFAAVAAAVMMMGPLPWAVVPLAMVARKVPEVPEAPEAPVVLEVPEVLAVLQVPVDGKLPR